ncbi:MAG: hypothetical protein V3S17_03705, partial [candidate division Zixibacteria bacterium]
MPKEYLFKDEINIVSEFDIVWDAVLSFFKKYEIEVTTADKVSGIIIAESKYFPNGWADCGR